jgi:ribosomal protein L40E
MTRVPTDWHFDLPLRDEAELRLFVEKAWGVTIPNVQVCPEHTTPWRAFADAYFATSPLTIWRASRGFGGKSFLLALLGLTEAVTLKCNVNVLGGSGEQSGRVLEYIGEFLNHRNAPRDMLASDVKRETRLIWGNKIKALMASQTSVRGPHIPRLRLDEIDEMALDIFDAAMGQTMAEIENGQITIPAQTVASSTHHHANGTMTEVLKRAKDRGYPVHTWCYKETSAAGGWLIQSEIERKRLEVTDSQWRIEYQHQEPSPEDRAIRPQSVEAMFDKKLGHYQGANQEYIEVEPPLQVCNDCGGEVEWGAEKCPHCNGVNLRKASYSTGADWAKKIDWTVIVTFRTDTTPIRLVAFERCGRLPWPMMVKKFDERIRRYPGRAAHDGTGLGDVVKDSLSVGAEGVIMVGRARSDMLSNYVSAIERGEYIAPVIDFMHDGHKYASVDDVYGKGHLPDDIAAGALAHHSARRGVGVW